MGEYCSRIYTLHTEAVGIGHIRQFVRQGDSGRNKMSERFEAAYFTLYFQLPRYFSTITLQYLASKRCALATASMVSLSLLFAAARTDFLG